VLFLGVAGVLLPYLYGGIDNVKAVSFSSVATIAENTYGYENTLKLQKINGIYYSSHLANDGDGDGALTIATSSDGSTWGSPYTAMTDISPKDCEFGYYENGGYFYAIFSNYNNNDHTPTEIVITTSSDTITWSATSTVVNNIDPVVDNDIKVFSSVVSSSNYLSFAYFNVDSGVVILATSSNGVSWATSSIFDSAVGMDGFVTDGSDNMHVIYGVLSDQNYNTSTQVYLKYANSTDGGVTWTSSTIDRVDYEYYTSSIIGSIALDDSGNPGIDEIGDFVWDGAESWWGGDGNVTTSLVYAKYSGSSWSSSTVYTFPLAIVSTTNGINIRPSLKFAPDGEAMFVVMGQSYYPYLITNTNTLDISQVEITQVDNKSMVDIEFWRAGVSLVYYTSTLDVGIAYMADDGSGTDQDLFFVTSSAILSVAEVAWDGSLSSITDAQSNSWTRLIYANGQYNYYYAGLNNGQYYINLTTSTNGVDGTWSDAVLAIEDSIRTSIDGDLSWPLFDIQYNSSTDYFGLTAYVSSTGVMMFTTSSDGVTWGSPISIYTFDGVAGEEWLVNMDFLEGTDLVSIGYEFDKIAFSDDAGVTWSTSTISAMDSNDDLFGVGITTGPVLHAGYAVSSDNSVFYYASSTDNGVTWTTTTVHVATSGTNSLINSFVMDGNNRPSLLIGDNQQGAVGIATSTMLFASRNDNGTWTTSTVGSNNYSFTDGVVLSDMGFYGAKPYMVYFGNSNYANFAYSTSTASPFTFTTSSIDGANAVGEMSRMSTTYDSANTTAAVAYVTDSGELRFATSSVDLVSVAEVGSAPTAPSGVTASGISTSSIEYFYWTDNSDDEDGFIIGTSEDGVNYDDDPSITANATSTLPDPIEGLTPNTQYWFHVGAYNAYGTSTYAVTTTYTNPDVPSTPTISNVSTSSLALTWNENLNASNTAYFILYSDGTTSTISSATTTSITGLTPNTEYTFAVRAQYLSSSTLYTAYSVSSTVTSTLADNNAPSFSLSDGSFATNGTGLYTAVGVIIDVDNDSPLSLYIDYSLDSGSTWSSSTIGSTTQGSISTTGTINGITGDNHGVGITFTWDTQADGVTVTTTAMLRMTPFDGTDYGSTVTTSAFTVDNIDPSAPTISTSTPSTTGITVEWNAIAGASTYTVSTTAGSTTTTSETSVTYSSLTPNTQYSIQIFATDAYGNASSYSTATSTYTLASTPTAPTVTVASTTILNVTVADDGATTYAVKVVTGATTKYLQADGTIGDSAVWFTYAQLGGGLATSTTGLTANTSYTVSVAGKNGDEVVTSYTPASAVYTLANQASTPTIGTPTTSTLPITINVNSNPAVITYAVYNSTDGNYLDTAGASTSTAVYSTTSTLGSSFAATGLSPNTAYEFTVIARNEDDVDAATSTASTETYTNPDIPGTPSVTATGQTTMTVTWSANSNGTGNVYELYNVTDSSIVATTTAVSYSVTGLTANTSYVFKVRAQYLSNSSTYSSYSSNSTAVSTDATPATPASSGGGSAPAPTPPSAPTTVAPAIVSLTLTPNSPQTVSIGNTSHTVTASTPSSNGSVTITIQSDPITITLKPGEEMLVDTNKDNKDDIFVRYDSLEGDNVKLTISAIEDLEFSINQALSTTDKQVVTLYFNSPDASLVAISNSSDFTNVSFETYTPTKPWTLTPGNGLKTVYVKFRTAEGGTREVSDNITLTNQATDQVNGTVCTLTPEQSYKLLNSPAVYYITTDCTKRAFTKSNIFFTYFTSWNDVNITTKEKLDSIPNDTLGFMSYGPKYDPKYGALVKIVSDPKVYLLLNTEKYWITSELVFNALKYAWNWIEDVDARLLNKYTIGSEINYTDHHPNYTLVKYKDNNKVYRLEPNNEGVQTKRWIADEATFNSLNFRWDRIVTVSDTEVYETGEDLGVEVVNTQTSKYTFTSFLSLGSIGEEVKQLQIRLQELGYLDKDITPTTNFGPATQQAVIKLQTEHNLVPAEGYVGPGTRAILNGN